MINTKEKIFLFTTLLYIVVLTLPLFAYYTRLNIPVMSILVFVVCIVSYPGAMNNRLFWWMLVYFGILILYGLFGKITVPGIGGGLSVYRTLTIEMAFYLPNVAIISVLFYLNKKKFYNTIFITALISLFITFVYCFFLLQQNYYILRSNEVVDINDSTRIFGTPNYALMHAYLLMIPVLVFAVKNLKGYRKLVYLFIMVCFGYLVVHTFITTTLLLLVALTIFLLVYRDNKPVVTIVVSLLAFIVFFMIYQLDVLKTVMPVLNDFFSETAVSSKLENGSEYLEGRESLHVISWNSFLQNPIIGYPVVGGHSNLMDRLGGMGLVCFIPYIMMIISAIKMTIQCLSEKRIYYYLCLFCVAVLLYEKGIFNYEGWCFFLVIVPCGLICFSNHPYKNLKITKN